MGEKKDNLFTVQQSAPVLDTKLMVNLPVTVPGIALKERKDTRWNTKNIAQRTVVDAACAGSAAGLVAPIICMIDKAIIENASGKQPMMQSLRSSMSSLLFQPHVFLTSKPFALIFMLYSGTYFAANSLDTFKSTVSNKAASATTSGPAKFVATSATNLSLCLYKDSQFTKLFGTVSPRPVPPVTYALFAVRDCLTIFASFNLPPILAPALPISEKYVSTASAAQFIAPAAIQLISTPFHLMGLDLYNRNGSTTLRDRLHKVRLDWLKSSVARMCRIVPAFGLGGVVNTSMRLKGMEALQ